MSGGAADLQPRRGLSPDGDAKKPPALRGAFLAGDDLQQHHLGRVKDCLLYTSVLDLGVVPGVGPLF